MFCHFNIELRNDGLKNDVTNLVAQMPATIAMQKIITSIFPVPNAGMAPPGQKPAMPQPMPKSAEPPISLASSSWRFGKSKLAFSQGAGCANIYL